MNNERDRSFADFFADLVTGGRSANGRGREKGRAEAGASPRLQSFGMGQNETDLPPELEQLQKELEKLFNFNSDEDCGDPKCVLHGAKQKKDEPKVNWRRKLSKFKMGMPVEADTRLGLVGMLGLQAWQIAEIKARETGESLKRTVQKALGELQFAVAQSTTGQIALAEAAVEYGKALEAAAAEHEELVARMAESVGSATSSMRYWFSYGDVSRAWNLVKNGLEVGETYFPEEGLSSIEQQIETAQHTVTRLAEVQALLTERGQGGLATFLAAVAEKGDLTEAINALVGAPAVPAEPIADPLEAPPAEINV